MIDTLDSLFADARRAYEKTAPPKGQVAVTPAKSAERKWVRGFNVRLIHAGTDTLLGDFSEWLSPRDGARRLVREMDGSLPIDKIERIAGDWGVNTPPPPECPHTQESYCISLNIMLEETVPLSGTADLLVSFEAGAIISACLLADSTFYDGQGKILELPADFNIYPLLTRAAKIKVFTAVRQIFPSYTTKEQV